MNRDHAKRALEHQLRLMGVEHPRERVFRYVRHPDVIDYLRLGWHIAEADLGRHSEWAILMEWLCQCNMVEPCSSKPTS
jgi:hypothetical protein